MDSTRWRRIRELFDQTVDRPAADRDQFLTQSCGADDALRRDLDELLAAHGEAGGFLESPTNGEAAPDDSISAEVFDDFQRALAGRYSIERELGRGGMAIVYLARDVTLDRQVAIKLLPPRLAADQAYRERFLREARTAASLSHPNIVPIHLVDAAGDLVYFVMAYVDGESLGDRIRRGGPLDPATAARVVREVSWALAHAHGRGIVHRDIKPDNILFDRATGRAMVTDFGIAWVPATAPGSSEVIGTVAYMSPEQVAADPSIDGRADLYSLGVTAYFALTGRLPFDARGPIARAREEPAPPIRSIAPFVPVRLADAVERCLASEPAGRHRSAEALADAVIDPRLTGREVAPSVRAFLAAAKSGAVQTGMLAAMWMGAGIAGLANAGAGGQTFIGLLLAMTPLVLVHPILAARGVLRAGLDRRDVVRAVDGSIAERDANIEYEIARADRLARWLASPVARGVVLAMAVPFPFMLPRLILDLIRAGVSLEALGILLFIGLVSGVEAFFLGLAIAPRRTAAALTRGTKENAGLLTRIWRGPLGRGLFKLAGVGLPRIATAPALESAPTEVLLGRAAEQLFERLADSERNRLGDVPRVIASLTRAAEALRARRADLDQGLAEAGAAGSSAERARVIVELESARAEVDERLGAAVASLERLRLDLLRLRAGLAPTEQLTASIDEADAIRAAVERELAAHREVTGST